MVFRVNLFNAPLSRNGAGKNPQNEPFRTNDPIRQRVPFLSELIHSYAQAEFEPGTRASLST